MEQIQSESNSDTDRKELIEGAKELFKYIVNYHDKRKQSTHINSDGNQERKKTALCCCVKHKPSTSDRGDSGIEMSVRIEGDCEARRGPPPPPSSNGPRPSDSPHHPHPATGNEIEVKVSQGSTASLVDDALDAFVRDLQRSITERSIAE
jgi:hypothetical protein